MPIAPELLAVFAGATVLLFLTPGPAMTVVLANGAAHGTRAGLATVAGNVLGFAVMLALVLAGLQWIVSSFADWFPYVRLAGALYLVGLGLSTLAATLRRRDAAGPGRRGGSGGHFRDGLVVAFANPAVIAFLAAFLPQFIDASRPTAPQFLVLAAAFLAIAFLVGAALSVAADRAGKLLLGGNAVLIDRVAGAVLVLGGLMLALAGRG